MRLHHGDERVTLWHGDCLEVLRSLADASVDSVVTDPPYLLGFMGREWDTKRGHEHLGWHRAWCDEAFRALKPGGHLLAFGGTRTWHRLACAVEDAGFEVRDSIAWLYGSGFPKSLDVSKAIDKAAGAERGTLYVAHGDNRIFGEGKGKAAGVDRTPGANLSGPPVTDAAQQWTGWGTALKPAFEPIVVARKPLAGTVAANVLEHGTGALNIDATRTATNDDLNGGAYAKVGNRRESASLHAGSGMNVPGATTGKDYQQPAGRWPTNVVLDDTQAAELDEQSGERTSGSRKEGTYRGLGYMGSDDSDYPAIEGDTGGASRFFPTFRYEAKAPASERPKVNGTAHPTVKPLDLMRWLVRLVTPPGGTVLEPFAGSGTTVEAAIVEGFHCIAIEREADYLPLITQRINRRLNPVEAVRQVGGDLGLFDLEGEGA